MRTGFALALGAGPLHTWMVRRTKPQTKPETPPAGVIAEGADGNDTPAAGSHAAAFGKRAKEIGGAVGPEPTRYGDWEKNGRCTDF